MFALWIKGAVVVPLNPKFPEKQKRELLKKTGSTFLEQFELSKSNSKKSSNTKISISVNPKAWASIIFTSGSTGSAKAVVHSLENHLYSAIGANQVMPLNSGDRWLMSLPHYHVGGLAIFFRTILSGATLVAPSQKLNLAESLVKNKITHISLVPTQLHRLLGSNSGRKSLLDLKLILLGGSIIPKTLLEKAEGIGLNVKTTYGLTEMSSQVATGMNNYYQVLPFREVRISQDNSECSEIEVRGRTRFLGYLKESELIKPFDRNGWFKTGDLGKVNLKEDVKKKLRPMKEDNGFQNFSKKQSERYPIFSIVGRKDNMFISGGENIYPEEIENVLYRSGMVDEAIVVPVKSIEFGKRPVAFLKYKKFSSKDKLVHFLDKHLVSFKVPDLLLSWPEDKNLGFKPSRDELSKKAQVKFDSTSSKLLLAEKVENTKVFEQWTTDQDIGWKRIAIYDGRQIFQLLDQRDKNHLKCIYLVANSREEIMEWLLASENRMIHKNYDKRSQIIDWIPIKKNNRGKMYESFEIIRLLDDEIPKEEFFLFDANERGRFNPFMFDPKKKIKISGDRIKKVHFKINNYVKLINKFNHGWPWDFPIAVFQLGLEILKFKRKYLLRCLYKRVNSGKIFMGWKVQLIIELSTKEKIENPFWNLSREEETMLENLMQDAGFFNKKEYLNSNTAKKEHQRRFNFQNEIESLYF